MLCCPTCGMPQSDRYEYGPLLATTEPPAVYCHGVRMKLTPMQVNIMTLLIRNHSASHFALTIVGTTDRGETGANPIDVQICRIRRLLPRPMEIRNIFGWGYELLLSPPREIDVIDVGGRRASAATLRPPDGC